MTADVRHTRHEDREQPSELARSFAGLVAAVHVSTACEDRLCAQLEGIVIALDRGYVLQARAIAATALRERTGL